MQSVLARRHSTSIVTLGLVLLVLSLFAVRAGWGADGDAARLDDANQLFREALALKKEGKAAAACATFEKAMRTHRGILAEDDDGLLHMLQKSHEARLASAPTDVHVLEGLGFIHSVGLGENDKALEYYKRLLALVKDEKVRQKTQYLVDRLQAEKDMARQYHADLSAKAREERLREWAEIEKQQALATIGDQKADIETRLAEAQSRKDQLGARVPQLEDELKDLREADDRNTRLWHTMNNERYRREYRAARERLGVAERELTDVKRQLNQATEEVKMLSKNLEIISKQAADRAKAAAGGTSLSVTPPHDPAASGSAAVSGTDDGSAAAHGSAPGDPGAGSGGEGSPTDTASDAGAAGAGSGEVGSGDAGSEAATGSATGSGADPAIPPEALGSGAENPDFPSN